MFFSSPLLFWDFLGVIKSIACALEAPAPLPVPLQELFWEAPSPGLEGQERNPPLEGSWDSDSSSGGAEKGEIWGFLSFLDPLPVQSSELSLVKDSEEPHTAILGI